MLIFTDGGESTEYVAWVEVTRMNFDPPVPVEVRK